MGINELLGKKLLLLDGSIEVMLQKHGVKLDEYLEILNIKKPEIIKNIHREYIRAGADIIRTNTFGANEKKLANCAYTVEEIIERSVKIAKEAVNASNTYVALSIGPIGEALEPIGTLSFDEAYEIFKRQILAGKEANVDLVLIEAMTDLYEMKAAILAIKENSDLPIFATMTFEENQRTITGCIPEAMVLTLEGLGVDALGIYSSKNLKEISPIIKKISVLSNIHIIVQATAEFPKYKNGEINFEVDKNNFNNEIDNLLKLGVSVIGGGYGIIADYIKEIKNRFCNKELIKREKNEVVGVCSNSKVVFIDGVKVVGERINPTGKKIFKETLLKGDMNYILNLAMMQVEAGADILDINVGIQEANEEMLMVNIIKKIQSTLDTPLQIDSINKNVIEKALRYYNGKPIVNSINGDIKSLEDILPLVKKYGASVIGLTLDSSGIPTKAEERVKIAERIIKIAEGYGINKKNIFIDCLVLTAVVQQKEVRETLKAVSLVKEKLNVKTLLGISNISFGLPNRASINESFLALALGVGLDLPIINPNSERVMNVIRAYRVLNNDDIDAEDYIAIYGDKKSFKN